jgi:hypothetical protein
MKTRFITMNIENHRLDNAGYESSILYRQNDSEISIIAEIYRKYERTEYIHPAVESGEFTNIEDAIKFLEIECELLVIEELTQRERKGRWAKEILDEIKEKGFEL